MTTALTVAGVIAVVVAASIIDGWCGLLAKECMTDTPLGNSWPLATARRPRRKPVSITGHANVNAESSVDTRPDW